MRALMAVATLLLPFSLPETAVADPADSTRIIQRTGWGAAAATSRSRTPATDTGGVTPGSARPSLIPTSPLPVPPSTPRARTARTLLPTSRPASYLAHRAVRAVESPILRPQQGNASFQGQASHCHGDRR